MKTYMGKRVDRREEPDGRHEVVVIDGATTYPLTHVVKHSPDGFEWGYGGSGPAELARCILIDYFDGNGNEADRFYQQFKWDIIAAIKTDQWTIESKQIQEWIEKQEKKD